MLLAMILPLQITKARNHKKTHFQQRKDVMNHNFEYNSTNQNSSLSKDHYNLFAVSLKQYKIPSTKFIVILTNGKQH